MKKSQEIAAKIDELRSNVEAIVTLCEREGRDLNAQEQKQVDAALGAGNDAGEISRLTAELDRQKRIEAEASVRIRETLGPALRQQMVDAGMGRTSDGPVLFRNQATGQPVKAFFRGQPMAAGSNPYELGELITAAVCGRRSWYSDNVLNALSTGSNSGGGYAVPSTIWQGFIDYARNKPAILEAGAGIVEMTGNEMSLVAVASDPVFESKVENEKFTGSDVSFRSVSLQSKTHGQTIRLSRELFEDGQNIAQIVTSVLARSFASHLDQMALNGSAGGTTLWGLLNRPGITDSGTTSIGSLAWTDILMGWSKVRARNHMPTAAIFSPASLYSLWASFGADSWTSSPPVMQGVQILDTANAPTDKGIIGDFGQCLFGVRRSAMIEVSVDGNEDFERHSVTLKLGSVSKLILI